MSKKSKKDAKKPKSGKKDKGKKEYSSAKTYNHFNTLDYKTLTPEHFIESLYTNAHAVLIVHSLSINVWSTFSNLENQIKKTWDDKDFIRFWLDRIVEEFGYMIWNEMYKKYWCEEWYRDGILHNVLELPKKIRANPEAVAGHFADTAVNKYKEHYK